MILADIFQLGLLLGSKHAKNADEFGYAFLSAQGEPGSVLNLL